VEFVDRAEREGIERRAFLGLLAAGLVALLPGSALGVPRRKRKKTKRVFRLSTH